MNRRRTRISVRLSALVVLTVGTGALGTASKLDGDGAEFEAMSVPATVPMKLPAEPQSRECVDAIASRPRMTPNDPDIISGLMDRSTILLIPPPDSLYQLVTDADAIVIGAIAGGVREATEGPYSREDGKLQPPRVLSSVDQSSNVIEHPGIAVTYYSAEIERVLMSDGRIDEGGSFELRLFGHTSELDGMGSGVMPMPRTGGRLLLVLEANPDLRSYGTRGPWGQIELDGAQPRYRDWGRTPPPFAECTSPRDFLTELEAMIARVERERFR